MRHPEKNVLNLEYVIGQHLGDSGEDADVHEGQTAEEEVHGSIQVGVHADGP